MRANRPEREEKKMYQNNSDNDVTIGYCKKLFKLIGMLGLVGVGASAYLIPHYQNEINGIDDILGRIRCGDKPRLPSEKCAYAYRVQAEDEDRTFLISPEEDPEASAEAEGRNCSTLWNDYSWIKCINDAREEQHTNLTRQLQDATNDHVRGIVYGVGGSLALCVAAVFYHNLEKSELQNGILDTHEALLSERNGDEVKQYEEKDLENAKQSAAALN